MPNYSKALSLELNQLFEKVEKQADEYIKAFSSLKNRIEDFDKKAKELDHYKEYFTNNFTNLAAETRINVTESIETLKDKLDLVIELYNEYDQIVAFKETLILLHNQMRMLIAQNEIKQEEFRNKSEYEINNLIINSKNKLEKEVKNVYSIIETKFDGKIKFLETQIIKLDQKLLLIEENLKKEVLANKSDINRIENLSNAGAYSTPKIVNNKISELEQQFENIKLKNEQLFVDLVDARSSTDKIEGIIDDLNKTSKLSKINQSKISTIMQNNSSSKTLSVVSLILAIIALLLAIVI